MPRTTQNLSAIGCTLLTAALLLGCSHPEVQRRATKAKKTPSEDGKPTEETLAASPFLEDGEVEAAETCARFSLVEEEGAPKKDGDLFVTQFFRKKAAVDPAGTGTLATVPGYITPEVTDAKDLALSRFRFPRLVVAALVDQGVQRLEVAAYASQRGNGLDIVNLQLTADGQKLRAKSNVNIHSAFGYVSLFNLKRDGDTLRGDAHLKAFAYDPAEANPLTESIRAFGNEHDKTDISGAAFDEDPDGLTRDLDLSTIDVQVALDAETYDSVQFRAVRIRAWSAQGPPEVPLICP